MHPGKTNPSNSSRIRFALAAVVASGAVLLLKLPVHAHVISSERGSVTVHPDHIKVEWQVHAEDFAHYYGLGRVPSRPFSMIELRRVADGHADQLLEHLIIRDSAGERLVGKTFSRAMDPIEDVNADSEVLSALRVNYVFEYPLKSPPRYLSFQRSSRESAVWSPSQVFLAVRLAESDRIETICLTRGANVETLEFDWQDAGRGHSAMIGPVKRLKTITAHIDVVKDEVRVAVEIPLPLLETFLSVDRADQDFLDPSEQENAIPRLSAFLRDRNPIRINSQAADAGMTRLQFLGVGSSGLDAETNSTRFGAWMTVVRFVQTYNCDSTPREFELRWSLFNPAVLVAEACITCGGQSSTRRISTYEPTLRWSQEASHNARSTATSPRAGHLAPESPSLDETVIKESGKSRE